MPGTQMHWQYPPADPGGAEDLLDERINYFLGNSLHHIGQGNTGSDCIHSNTLRTQFSGKGNRQAIDSKFGCGISNATGLAVNADH